MGKSSNTISQPDLPTVAATLCALEIGRTFENQVADKANFGN